MSTNTKILYLFCGWGQVHATVYQELKNTNENTNKIQIKSKYKYKQKIWKYKYKVEGATLYRDTAGAA